ncbi:MAG: hypothetical protein KKG59_03085 [Nanoarchaeota archaeon]|nr:hypothetical protein [Nanoarchaeota archaeon]
MAMQMMQTPWNQDSNLTGIAKKAELAKTSFTGIGIVRNVVAAIIIAAVLIVVLQLPKDKVILIAAIEIIFQIFGGIVTFNKFKTIKAIKKPTNSQYREILIKTEYFGLQRVAISTASALIMLGIVYYTIDTFKIDFESIPLLASLSDYTHIVLYIIIAVMTLRLLELAFKYIRYKVYSTLPENCEFDELNRKYSLIKEKLDLVTFIPVMSIVIVVMIISPIPAIGPILFGIFGIGFVWLSITKIKRVKNVQFQKDVIEDTRKIHIESLSGETISGSVFGVLKAAATFKDIFQVQGSSFAGTGKHKFPENSIVVTNKRILLVFVPVTGGNKIVDGTDYVTQNFYYNRSEIIAKGKEFVKKPLRDILAATTRTYSFSDIKSARIKQAEILLTLNSGIKIKYIFLDREIGDELYSLLAPLSDKVVKK